jgi:hypothetical protein
MPEKILLKFNIENAEKWNITDINEYNKIANEIYRKDSMY